MPDNMSEVNQSVWTGLAARGFVPVSSLGRGKFGSCYTVRRESDGQILALKVIDLDKIPESDHNLALSEASLLQKVKHWNVVGLVTSWREESRVSIIMEYCRSGDLELVLAHRAGQLSEDKVLSILTQVARGLKAMHDRGVMHRDVKPQNVFIEGDRAVVGDLGLSCSADLASVSFSASSRVGSPAYWAPEVVLRKRYDAKADVWSLGCITYELAVGELPFGKDAASLEELEACILAQPLRLDALSPGLGALIARMLNKDAANRASIDDVLAAAILQPHLRHCLEQESSHAAAVRKASAAGADAAHAVPVGPRARPLPPKQPELPTGCPITGFASRHCAPLRFATAGFSTLGSLVRPPPCASAVLAAGAHLHPALPTAAAAARPPLHSGIGSAAVPVLSGVLRTGSQGVAAAEPLSTLGRTSTIRALKALRFLSRL